MSSIDTPIASRLKRAIENHAIIKTAAELSRASGVTEATVSNWLGNKVREDQGKGLIGVQHSRALGIRVEWLFTGAGAMRPSVTTEPAVGDGYPIGRSVDMNSIGARIRAVRETQGVTRKELATFAGLSYTGLSDLEAGKSRSTTVLHKIAERLGLSVKWLETGKGPMDSPLKPMTLDAGKLAHAIDLLRTLGEIQGVPELHADAEALALAYGFLTEIDATVDRSNALDLTRRLAQRLRGQLEEDDETID